jgi:hypothetical protein
MLFAHRKRILKLDRLRLRGPNGAKDEFLLAATAQNLRKFAKLIPMPVAPLPARAGSVPFNQIEPVPSPPPTPTSSTQSRNSGPLRPRGGKLRHPPSAASAPRSCACSDPDTRLKTAWGTATFS